MRSGNLEIKGGAGLLFILLSSAIMGQELLTMERSMDFAVENSPDMQQMELALVQSQERLNAQRARLKSQFAISLAIALPHQNLVWVPPRAAYSHSASLGNRYCRPVCLLNQRT